MVKMDLKDAYLTISIAQNFQSLLAFQAKPQEIIQFQCLPFGLCTAPLVFSKVTKPITQFLHQLGIHLIIYLDDLMLAAPSESQLLQDLSTALWLFVALGFIINIPKSVTVPTQCLEFLGFVINTQNATNHSNITEDSINSGGGTTLVVSRYSPVEDPSTFHWHPGGHKASGTYRVFTLLCFTGSQDKDTSPILFYQVMGQVTKEVRWIYGDGQLSFPLAALPQ